MANKIKELRLLKISDIKPNEFYSTGEMLFLFKRLGLPSTKVWLYNNIRDENIDDKLFVRPFSDSGWRYIKGSDLLHLMSSKFGIN